MTFQIEIEAKFASLDLIVPGASTSLTGCARSDPPGATHKPSR
jgi:hypothetical protein